MMEIDSEFLPKKESESNENLSPIERLPQELAYHIIEFAEPNGTKQLTRFDLANKKCNFWTNSYRNENPFWEKQLEHLVGKRLTAELIERFSSYKKAFLYVEHLTTASLNGIQFSEILILLKAVRLEINLRNGDLNIAQPNDFIVDNEINYDSSWAKVFLNSVTSATISAQVSVFQNLKQMLKKLGMNEVEILDFVPCFIAKKYLTINNPDVSVNTNVNLLHLYASFGFCDGIKYLIFNGEDINKRVQLPKNINEIYIPELDNDETGDENPGRTPLEAVFISRTLGYKHCQDVFKIFFEAGCNINLKTILLFFKNTRRFVDGNIKCLFGIYEQLMQKFEAENQTEFNKIIYALFNAIEDSYSDILKYKQKYLHKFHELTYQKYFGVKYNELLDETKIMANKIEELESTIAGLRGYQAPTEQEEAPDQGSDSDQESDSDDSESERSFKRARTG